VKHKDVIEIIKNGWENLLKGADLSNINADQLLLRASYERWKAAGVNLLIKKLGTYVGIKSADNLNPLMNVCINGNDEVARLLVQLDSELDHKIIYNITALHYAV